MTTITNSFIHFEVIKDYRQAAKVEHKLSDIILLTICGVLSGFDTWEGICDFGESRTDFLKSLGDFKNGIPSSDTIARVMGMVKAFAALTTNLTNVLQFIWSNAFATAQGLCLGQSKVDDKTNEITEIPKLLELRNISGCLVTNDTMGCQRKIAQR